MSDDNGNNGNNGNKPEEPANGVGNGGEPPEEQSAEPGEVKIIITLDKRGQVLVGGPIDNAVLCYGILELAKDAIRAHIAAAARRRQATGLILPGGRLIS